MLRKGTMRKKVRMQRKMDNEEESADAKEKMYAIDTMPVYVNDENISQDVVDLSKRGNNCGSREYIINNECT